MIPAAFEYERPDSVADAVSLLTRHGDGARVLAGGHSLVPMMKLRLASPEVLVDLGGIVSLRGVRDTGDAIAIGAMTRHADVAGSDMVRAGCPVLAETAAHIGDMQVRARGTIGGSLAQADPHGDLPAVFLALGGEVAAEGPGGTRTIPADDWFVDFLTTSLAPDEVLTEVRVPRCSRAAYVKFNRRSQDWALVGVAAAISDGGVRIAITGVGPRPTRATAAEQAYTGGDAAAAADAAADGLNPPGDTAGSSEYRLHLVRTLTRRALDQAAAG